MGKVVHNDVLDAALNILKNNVTTQSVNSAEPATFAIANDATTGNALGFARSRTTAHVTVADGDASGRKATISATTGRSVDKTGVASHVCLLSTSDSRLLYITTCTTQSLTTGNTFTCPAWDIEIADPT